MNLALKIGTVLQIVIILLVAYHFLTSDTNNEKAGLFFGIMFLAVPGHIIATILSMIGAIVEWNEEINLKEKKD